MFMIWTYSLESDAYISQVQIMTKNLFNIFMVELRKNRL